MDESSEKVWLKNQIEKRVYGHSEDDVKNMWWMVDTALNSPIHAENKAYLLRLAECWGVFGRDAFIRALQRV